MDTSKNTILITGESSGIGLAMAQAFLTAGNTVLICGRREGKLAEAKQKLPQLHTKVCNLEIKQDREESFTWATSNFSSVNILVNNAGIQKEVDFLNGAVDLLESESEIEINLTASIHLCVPFL